MPTAFRSGVDPARERRSRPTREDPRRKQLLQDLEEIFLAEGFSSLTTDELCKRLRCSKSTLYSVAGSREQIIQAVVRHFFAHSTAAIEAKVSATTDPAGRIVEYLKGVGEAMDRNSPAFYEDMVSYPPTAEIYRLNSQAAADRVQAMIEEGLRDGIFRSADAALASLTVAYLMDGVQSGEVLEATGLSAGEAFAELGELLVHGLAVRSGKA
ncbi:TetR/AcrR family transcriptional regulator [Actinomadura opuntiae]|uniref:TetR/AcrR family transcriptional regulator n=1 Tax=Actinomadura sp. OS1-43 TaxID=604315 RepID=UPI00255AF91F|nr:TetR family transcriptional regulator [Actinomadura sp. OS1-43]MDL4814131.1 TetR family transcriptional regulator [Actinomadura sp. OS1-43]